MGVLGGSVWEWAGSFEPSYDLVVFLLLDPAVRSDCVSAETARYGKRKWAEAYDTAGLEERSLIGHATWLATRKCPCCGSILPYH